MAQSLTDGPSTVAPDAATKPRRTWHRVAHALIGAIVALGAWNATVFLPVRSALADESTHSVMVYRRWLVSSSQVVFDVRSASPQGSMADMDRLLFKSADALKESHFDVVVLAYRGSGKFLLAGDQFQTIGQTFASENPVFLMRTLTENVSEEVAGLVCTGIGNG